MHDNRPQAIDQTVMIYREEPKPSDIKDIQMIIASTGLFPATEIEVATEMLREHLEIGEESGYYFVLAEKHGTVVGFSCYGPTPGTVSSFDLYWIVVLEGFRGMGLGCHLIDITEVMIKKRGGTRVYIEMSSQEKFDPTRRFYEDCGYEMEARLKDYFAPGNSKVIYVKELC